MQIQKRELERETGLEPATLCLGRLGLTTRSLGHLLNLATHHSPSEADGRQIANRRYYTLLPVNSTLIHWHLLRHTFAVNYLVNGGDPFSLQRIMGHTTLEMVRRYIHLADVHVRLQHRRYSPMDVMQAATRQHAPAQGSGTLSRHRLALAQ